jgi:hypothetical protein
MLQRNEIVKRYEGSSETKAGIHPSPLVTPRGHPGTSANRRTQAGVHLLARRKCFGCLQRLAVEPDLPVADKQFRLRVPRSVHQAVQTLDELR